MLGWVDLEATGLSVETDSVLEIALVITDFDLEVIETFESCIHFDVDQHRDKIDPVVLDMHTNNNLWNDCKRSMYGVLSVDLKLGNILQNLDAIEYGNLRLAGNSVHFDRLFLRKYFPIVERAFMHRHIDVSTLNELTKNWAPDLYHRPKGNHRAMADIMSSIDTLREYKKALF